MPMKLLIATPTPPAQNPASLDESLIRRSLLGLAQPSNLERRSPEAPSSTTDTPRLAADPLTIRSTTNAGRWYL